MGLGRTVARCTAVVALLLLVGGTDSAAAEDGSADPVVVRTSWACAGDLAPPARPLQLTDAVPPGVVAPMHADGVHYAVVPFGAATLALAVDLRAGSERIWIDHDLDGDLGDDARAWWTRDGAGWVRAEHVLVSDARAREQTYVEIRVHAAGGGDSVTLSHALCRVGAAEIGGRMRSVVLLDADHDARFDSRQDHVLVDLDGDGQLDAGEETVIPGHAFRVASTGWLVERPTPSGAEVLFARAGTVPEARRRTWTDVAPPPCGVTPAPPEESLDDLLARLDVRPRSRAGPLVPERLDLVARIGRVGTDRAFAALEHRVRTDHVASVRAAATRAMGNPRFLADHVDAVVQLTDATTTGDPSRCVAALDALHAMDWPERGPLLQRLLSERRWMLAGGAASRVPA